MRKSVCIMLCVCVAFCLCSCERVIANKADELTFSSWRGEFENGNSITLSFSGHNASFVISEKDSNKVTIYGFCEISENEFVIHDSTTKSSFAFGYDVYFDHVDIVYDNYTLSLGKI